MFSDEEKMKIATFRFGIISEFVTGVKLSHGEKEALLRQKVGRAYEIPGSTKTSISKATIHLWVSAYRKAGFRIEGLIPKTRKDKGLFRKLDSSLCLAIKELKKENPYYPLSTIIKILQHRKVLGLEDQLNLASVYRFLKQENLSQPNLNASDCRAFEATLANQIWQCDVMHGPYLMIDGQKKKTYLFGIIDDYSRLIVHGEFFLSETLDSLKDALCQAITKRGLPQKFYVDNGACFNAVNLEQITAALGISLTHSRPYKPQGRGKIERFFRTIRDSFLPLHQDAKKLLELNERLENWLEEYHQKPHGTTKETPYQRYRSNLSCVRPAPPQLLNYFRHIEFRRVRKDRTVALAGRRFEAPVQLIDRRVELHYHASDLERVEIFFDQKSFGFAVPLDVRINARIGRNWSSGANKKEVTTEHSAKDIETPKPGLLFKGEFSHDEIS
jgi:transposase InsO family protein